MQHDGMDKFLLDRGLVRKTMPSDGSGIYRSVCEMISGVQLEAQTLKRIVELSIISKKPNFPLGYSERQRNELILTEISTLLRSNVEQFTEEGQHHHYFTNHGDPNKVLKFCDANSGLEAVYPFEDHVDLAVAQAITYKTMYNQVFEEPLHTIRYAISSIREDIDRSLLDSEYAEAPLDGIKKKSPPVPFSACKSLDPSIYRNVAFDVFIKTRRDRKQQLPEKKKAAIEKPSLVLFGVGTNVLVPDNKGIYHQGIVVEVVSSEQRKVRIYSNSMLVFASIFDLRSMSYESMLNIRLKLKDKTKNLHNEQQTKSGSVKTPNDSPRANKIYAKKAEVDSADSPSTKTVSPKVLTPTRPIYYDHNGRKVMFYPEVKMPPNGFSFMESQYAFPVINGVRLEGGKPSTEHQLII